MKHRVLKVLLTLACVFSMAVATVNAGTTDNPPTNPGGDVGVNYDLPDQLGD